MLSTADLAFWQPLLPPLGFHISDALSHGTSDQLILLAQVRREKKPYQAVKELKEICLCPSPAHRLA